MKTVKFKGQQISVWDVGGQKAIRQYWKKYLTKTDCLIYVVDSSDVARIEETSVEFESLLQDENLTRVPILVFANKQDIFGSQTTSQIAEALDLANLRERTWQIQACSAKENKGLQEGLDWLVQKVDKK
ncbi:MAG: hypothetical protein EZS28_046463, partial [Streblomastix strix]